MILTRKALPRRTFLKGMGTAVALPFLDAMIPATAKAQSASRAAKPVRMAFVYVPNGIDMRHWNPSYEGELAGIAAHPDAARAFQERHHAAGQPDPQHRPGLARWRRRSWPLRGSYLTGVQVKKTVVDIKASVSCDQLVANEIGKQTRFPSLEVGLEDARQAGDCDSGYSCAYTNNLAWRNETQPLPPILDPRSLFDRLFGEDAALSPEARAQKNKYRRSILDFITEDTRALQSTLGPTDKRKLDQYLGSIRDIELQIEKAEKDNAQIDPHMEKPYGIPQDFAEHFKLMTDMITVAFQADLTRVVTFLVTREGTSRAYRELGISDGHHPLTHHRNQIELMDKVAKINLYHVQQFAKWVEVLKTSQEPGGFDSGQLDDRLRRGLVRRQFAPASRSAHADRRPRRGLHQARPPHCLPEGNSDVQSVPDDDGSHGLPHGALRRLDRTPRRAGSGVRNR